ncbi:hypothetical protein Sjap_022332 [Stephania japonica]|uniref:Uncharacterized protein n=1 Tax=Stephania japonica TaxID=461633 RepID=A0AAP0ENQ7_9MAGN
MKSPNKEIHEEECNYGCQLFIPNFVTRGESTLKDLKKHSKGAWKNMHASS